MKKLYFLLLAPLILLSQKPYHHTKDGFRNLPKAIYEKESSFFKALYRFTIGRIFEEAKEEDRPSITIPKDYSIPSKKALNLWQNTSGDKIAWIGHMTTLIKLDDKHILTDPFFSDYASPIPPIGPKRIVKAGMSIKDLPKVDIIIISHSHYDHLDIPSLENIPNKENISIIVPLKVSQYFEHLNFKEVIELDWHENTQIDSITITAMPVTHWSKRSLFATNDTLWAGYSIISKHKKIFFSGDLEYASYYKELGEKYGPFDLAILSISPYKPKEVMRGSHCEPKNCLNLALDLKAKNFMPIHWGTILLGYNYLYEPLHDFISGAKELGIKNKQLFIFKIGETKSLGSPNE